MTAATDRNILHCSDCGHWLYRTPTRVQLCPVCSTLAGGHRA